MAGQRVRNLFRLGQPAQSDAGGDDHARESAMKGEAGGITKAGTGMDGIVWQILGQTYVPKQMTESSFSWHATLPPGTFVPPHIHPTQDEYIYLMEGRIDLLLDGRDYVATPGDLIRLPMGVPHGIFNKSDQTVKCLFWVTPTRKLYDLFWGIHSMPEQKPDEVVALSAKHEVVFLPPPA
jgi:quercetin dioxygenase-like cupin family protein